MKKSFFKTFGVSALFIAVASQSIAQDAPALVPTDSVFILNSLLFLVGGFLVFWMAAGFSMLEAGFSPFEKCNDATNKEYGSIFLSCTILLLNWLQLDVSPWRLDV